MTERLVIKRDGRKQVFDPEKIYKVLDNAFKSQGSICPSKLKAQTFVRVQELFDIKEEISVEDIQDIVEDILMSSKHRDVAKAYILYREKHKEMRLIEERVRYINEYIHSNDNAATSSETDANANVMIKNVANIDGEVYKTLNRQIQRYRMRKKLEQSDGLSI